MKTLVSIVLLIAANSYLFADSIWFEQRIKFFNNPVLSIMQGGDDMVWFGTGKGLFKYDSYELTKYLNNESDSLSILQNRIETLLKDSSGKLWIGCIGGLMLWEPTLNGFLRVDLIKEGVPAELINVRKIFEDSSGNIWIGTSQGLFKKTKTETDFIEYFNGHGLRERKQYEVRNIVEIDSMRLVITAPDEVLIISTKNNASYESLLLIEDARTMVFDKASQLLWIGTPSDQTPLISYNLSNSETKFHDLYNTQTNTIRSIKLNTNGDLWIGTLDGLVLFNHQTNSKQKYIDHTSIRDIYEDKNHGLWIATYNDGVYYFHHEINRFEHIYGNYNTSNRSDFQEQKRKEIITALTEVDDDIWIGTDFGLKTVNKVTQTLGYPLDSSITSQLASQKIKSLEYDQKENLLIGTFNGLCILNLESGKVTNVSLTEENKKQNWNHIMDIKYHNGFTWLASHGGGVFCLKNDEKIQYFDHFNIPSNQINTFHISKNTLWIGSNGGLTAIDLETREFKKLEKNKNYLFDNFNIESITEDEQHNLWLGTVSNGLIYFDPDSMQTMKINSPNSLINNNIKSIVLDKHDNLWVTTEKPSIFQITLNKEKPFDEGVITLNEFKVQNDFGLPVFIAQSTALSSAGDIYFGTHQGIIKFNPQLVKNKTKHSEVRIQDIRINQVSITQSKDLLQRFGAITEIKELNLNHDESVLSIDFFCLDFSNQDNYYYAVFMEGIDEEWRIIDETRNVNFNYLAPGEYTLKLKSSNNYKAWGDSYSQLNISIAPPAYKTLKAFIIYLLITSILLYAFYFYSSKWQKLKNRLEIEEINNQKEHEIHEAKSNFFLSVAHELKIPLSLILTPLQELLSEKYDAVGSKNRLTTINRNTKKIERLINQMVEVRKIETSVAKIAVYEMDIGKFVKELAKNFHSISRIKNIDFDINISQNIPAVWFDPNKMETVVSNLLSNSFKHTNEHGKVSVTVNYVKRKKQDVAALTFEDSGIGIPAENIPFLFKRFEKISSKNRGMSLGDGIGLDLTNKIIQLHHGQIKVESIPESSSNSGLTRFTIELLLGKGHFDPEEIKEGLVEQSKQGHQEIDESQYAIIETNESTQDDSHSLLIANKHHATKRNLDSHLSQNHQIYCTEDGLEAWKLVLDLSPELIICHVDLPTIDGLDLCKRIKHDERTGHIPVMLIAETEIHDTMADFTIDANFDYVHLESKVRLLIGQRNRIKQQIEKHSILKPEVLTSYDETLLDNIVAYLDQNLSDMDMSVEKLSGEIGISRTHLYRKTKELMNMSPNQFIRTYRIRKAAQMFLQEKLNISDIRIRVGFNDADYFRSCFKKEYGMTPSAYIEEHKVS